MTPLHKLFHIRPHLPATEQEVALHRPLREVQLPGYFGRALPLKMVQYIHLTPTGGQHRDLMPEQALQLFRHNAAFHIMDGNRPRLAHIRHGLALPIQPPEVDVACRRAVLPRYMPLPSRHGRSGPDQDVHGLRGNAPGPH